MNNIALIVTIVIAVVVLGIAFVVLWDIVVGRIDLQYLISESDGSASMSRFQLLIFTFVIALSYFLLLVTQLNAPGATPAKMVLPDLPNNVLTLLGISGGSYVLSKGIQKTAEVAAGHNPQ